LNKMEDIVLKYNNFGLFSKYRLMQNEYFAKSVFCVA